MSDLDQLLRTEDDATAALEPTRAPGKKPLTVGLRGSSAGPSRGAPVDHAAQGSIERSLGVELTRPGTAGSDRADQGSVGGSYEYLARGGGGSPLPSGAATALQHSYGTDLSSVRVHDGAASDGAARAMNAQAFAVGEDVHLSSGLDLSSEHGSFVLAHEVAHVVQNRGGDAATVQPFAPDADHDAAPAERAADEAAEAALAGQQVAIARNPGGIRCFGAGTVKRLKKPDASGNNFVVEPGGHAYLTTQALQDMGLSADASVMGYQGNWMRDLSQANVPGLTAMVGAANLQAILQVLSIKEFGRGFDPKEFGTYDPVEHMDNPTDLRASDVYKQTEGTASPGPINPDSTIPIANVDVSGQANPVSGGDQTGYAKDGVDPRYQETATRMQTAGETMVNTQDQTAFQISNLGMPVYINTSKEWAKATLHKAAMLGKTKNDGLGPREFGSGIHAVQDYYAHSNFCEIAINVMIKEGKLVLPDGKGGKTKVDSTMRLDSHVHANDPNGEKGVSSINLKVKDLPGYNASMGNGGKGDREVMATGSFNLTDTAVSLLHVLKEKVLSVNPFKEKGKGPSELANACLDYMDMATPDRFNKTGMKIADMIRPIGSAIETLGGAGADVVDGVGQGAGMVLDGANAINSFFGGSATYWDKEKKAVTGATSGQAEKIREASAWVTKKADEIAGKQHILRDLYGWWSGIDLLAPLKAIARNIPIIGPKVVELIEKTEKAIRDFIQEELSAGWIAATNKIVTALQTIIDKLTKETNVKNKKTAGKDPAALGPDASWTEKLAHQIEEKKAKIARMLGGVGDLYDDEGNPQEGIAPQSYTPPSHSEVAKDHHDKEQEGGPEDHEHHDDEDGDAHQHGGDWLNGLAENLAGKCSKAVGAKVKAVWDIVDGDGGVMVGPETALLEVSKEVDAWMSHPEDCRDKWSGEVTKLMSNPEFAKAIVAKLQKQTQ